MRKAVRLRVRLVGGEPVKNGGRREMDAFTIQHAAQQMWVVGPVECGHHSIVFPHLDWSQATGSWTRRYGSLTGTTEINEMDRKTITLGADAGRW
jgi:hypothetical protein